MITVACGCTTEGLVTNMGHASRSEHTHWGIGPTQWTGCIIMTPLDEVQTSLTVLHLPEAQTVKRKGLQMNLV